MNDLDCNLANFWRSVRAGPEEVARWADWPVNEADLHARHRWLSGVREDWAAELAAFRASMREDPEFYDAKRAGWWVWGLCQWIGSGWCAQAAWEEQAEQGSEKTCGIHTAEYAKRPMLDKPGRGVHQLATRGPATAEHAQRPDLSGSRGITSQRARDLSNAGAWEKRPALHRGGRGVQGRRVREQLPDLSGDSGAAGRGIHASGLHQKMPKADRGSASRLQHAGLYEWMDRLCARLRYVRVCCGDWKRILGPSVTTNIGLTAVMLDPPYGAGAGRDPSIYAEESLDVASDVRRWAIENGDNPKLRIAYCSYGEDPVPDGWERVKWKAVGGYAASAGNHRNAHRETIDFSPHCLDPEKGQGELFSDGPRD